jgi:hypothetical protein
MKTYHLAIIKASAACEYLLPLQWCTITKHSLCHVFDVCGRIARYGVLATIRMMGVERFNKFLRSLMHARKHIEMTVAVGFGRYRMICEQRRMRPLGYFVLKPEASTAISYAGGYGRSWSTPPDHLQPIRRGQGVKLLGKPKTKTLSEDERAGLAAIFLTTNESFMRAHAGR